MIDRRINEIGVYMNQTIITYNEFGKMLDELCSQLKKSEIQFAAVNGLPRGGLAIATHISHQLNIPLILNLNQFASSFPNQMLLVVDDIIDSGRNFLRFLELNEVKKIKYALAALCCKPSDVVPNFHVLDFTENDWIVFPWEINPEINLLSNADLSGCCDAE